ncbi:MAG: Ribulose-phosphate 3-epimerase [Candidatus Thorarchaeota archaeon]|nr:MAG: Ribulose-phosphate 3-epimerase [Candidatus Thorarchaeota archaeon]
MKQIIAPSILSADFTNLEQDIKAAERGGADYFHIDVMDGHFVPNISYGPIMVKTMKKITDVPLDAHLMIENPDKYIPDFVKAGADLIIPHVEAPHDIYRSVQLINNLGVKAGIALNPGTPICCIEPLIEQIDAVLVMSVCPGFGGQSFQLESLRKVRKIRELLDDLKPSVHVAIDGGIKRQNVEEVQKAGANFFVMGSAVFGQEDIENTVRELKGVVENR